MFGGWNFLILSKWISWYFCITLTMWYWMLSLNQIVEVCYLLLFWKIYFQLHFTLAWFCSELSFFWYSLKHYSFSYEFYKYIPSIISLRCYSFPYRSHIVFIYLIWIIVTWLWWFYQLIHFDFWHGKNWRA